MASGTINKTFVTEVWTNPSAVSLPAGTVGAFANNTNWSIAKSGYKAVMASIIGVTHPANYSVQLSTNYDLTSVYLSFYRAQSGAYEVPVDDVKVAVLYEKG